MALRKIMWRVKEHANKISINAYAEILELEKRVKILK
jgi:hypothetical protein